MSIDDASGVLNDTVEVDALVGIGVNIRDVKRRGSFAFVVQIDTNNQLMDKVADARNSQKNPAYVMVPISGKSAKITY